MGNKDLRDSISRGSGLNSILNLKILLLLSSRQNGVFFQQIQSLLDKSKSQLSVSLTKLERNGFITKTNGRPQIINITIEGAQLADGTLKEINEIKQGNKENKIDRGPSEPDSAFEIFIEDFKSILKEEMMDMSRPQIPFEVISSITSNISDKLYDKLYELLKSLVSPRQD